MVDKLGKKVKMKPQQHGPFGISSFMCPRIVKTSFANKVVLDVFREGTRSKTSQTSNQRYTFELQRSPRKVWRRHETQKELLLKTRRGVCCDRP